MDNKFYVVGIGPGNKDFIHPQALRIIEACTVLIGGIRNLELFRYLNKEEIIIGAQLENIDRYIMDNFRIKSIVVLATGDPGLFSITEYLKRKLGHIEFDVLPGISSFQYLCAKVKMNWEDVFIVSSHGRELKDLAGIIKAHQKVAIFTGGGSTPASICDELITIGFGALKVTVGENLSYDNERIIIASANEISKLDFETLSIMLVENTSELVGNLMDEKSYWKYSTQGIPDNMFTRGDVPMTKEEVRSVTLSKLRLKEDSIVYDIGAGTGSVSIEAGLRMKNGKVFAIEKEKDAIELIKINIDKFGLSNISVIEGIAPEAIIGLPTPDRVFIGGSGGSMNGIIEMFSKIESKVRVVVNAIALESAYEALEAFNKNGYLDIDIVCVSVARGKLAGKKHLMQALNPVYIISAEA